MNIKDEKNIILVIEDSDEDFYATRRAFKKSGFSNQIIHCVDGEDALDYLYQQGKYSNLSHTALPTIILLDLNLPKKDGRKILEIIKKDVNLKEIPVLVLTTSLDDRDIDYCYATGANSYIQKPVDLEQFMESIQKLKNYWFDIVILPNSNRMT